MSSQCTFSIRNIFRASTSLQQPYVVAKKPHVDPSAKKPHVDRSPKKPPECANSNSIVCTQLVNHLCNIFPDACPDYVRTLCKGRSMDDVTLDQLITVILNGKCQKCQIHCLYCTVIVKLQRITSTRSVHGPLQKLTFFRRTS